MVDISREADKRNGIETIVDSNGMMCLDEEIIEGRLDHNKFLLITKE